MNLKTFSKRASELLAIHTPMLWVVTQEEKIAEKAVVKEAMRLNLAQHFYFCDTNGGAMMDPLSLMPATAQATGDLDDMFAEGDGSFQFPPTVPSLAAALAILRGAPENTMLVIRNADDVSRNPGAQRAIYDICMRDDHKERLYHPIVMISPDNEVPIMLRDFTTSLELPLMTEMENLMLIAPWAAKHDAKLTKAEAMTAARAATGLTTTKVMHALADSCNREHKIDPKIINDLRVEKIKQSSVLTYIEPKKTLDTVGGHDRLKTWIKEVKACMTPEAQKVHVKAAKGYVSVGLAGTGKTAIAEAIANEMNVPFIIFDLSKIMGGIVGQSETTARRAFEIIKAVGSCVVLLDECDKQLAGAGSNVTGVSDGGTIARVFDVVLQNLQENAGQFYILTANDISKLPSPLMRAGRLDRKWFFSFPSADERKDIFRIYFQQPEKEVSDDLVSYAARCADHFTGAEIETAVNNMVRISFLQHSVINKEIILQGIDEVSSIYETNREEVNELLDYARKNGIPGTSSGNEKPAKHVPEEEGHLASIDDMMRDIEEKEGDAAC